MSQKQVPPPTGGAIRVTAVPEVNLFFFSHEDGSPLLGADKQPVPAAEPTTYGAVALHMDRLTNMYMTLGPGEHAVTEIRTALGSSAMEGASDVTTSLIGGYGRQLREYMPPDVVTYNTQDASSFRVASLTFGELALASRQPTDEERTAYEARLAAVSDPKLLYERERVIVEEEAKDNLLSHDHALVDFRGDRFMIALDSTNSVIAVRLIQVVAGLSKGGIDRPALIAAVWQAMPLAERMLFTDQEAKLYAKTGGNLIDKQIKDVLVNITGRLLMTRRGEVGARYLTGSDPITVQIEATPPEAPYGTTVRRIFPPGTHRDELQAHNPPEPLTPEELTEGVDLVQLAQMSRGTRYPMTHADAIDTLDFIMGNNGKRALREALGANPPRGALENTLDRLHAVVRFNLGASYYVAYNDRTILGRLGRGATSGRKGALLSQLTDKWQIAPPAGSK